MTQQFLFRCGLNESIATVHSYECISVIESAYDAMSDGIPSFGIFSTSTSYTKSLIYELLENVKDALLKVVQRLLSALNNLQVNNIRLIKRYQEVLLDRLDKIKDPIVQKTFTYPALSNYPAVFSTTNIEREIIRLQSDIQSPDSLPTPQKIALRVDNILRDFTKQIIGQTADVGTLKTSVEKIVEKKARGKAITIEVTRDTLNRYMEQIDTYKTDKVYLNGLKKSITEEYQNIKSMYESVTEDPIALAKNTVRYQLSPEKEEFLANEYRRYADIHVEMLRLFNGFITVYNAAFSRMLSVLDEKIADRKNLIVTMFSTTGVFAALNTKEVGTYAAPIKYTPTKA